MALRFQRRIKVLPGFTINLSKSGVGVSVGTKGLRAGIDSKRRLYTNASLPGTGLSWREYYKASPRLVALAFVVAIALLAFIALFAAR
jgi:hypothetical protein